MEYPELQVYNQGQEPGIATSCLSLSSVVSVAMVKSYFYEPVKTWVKVNLTLSPEPFRSIAVPSSSRLSSHGNEEKGRSR